MYKLQTQYNFGSMSELFGEINIIVMLGTIGGYRP